MLVRCAFAEASLDETQTIRIDTSKPGLDILFSTASRVFDEVENLAFSGSDSFFLVSEIYELPSFCHSISVGETSICIAAASA